MPDSRRLKAVPSINDLPRLTTTKDERRLVEAATLWERALDVELLTRVLDERNIRANKGTLHLFEGKS